MSRDAIWTVSISSEYWIALVLRPFSRPCRRHVGQLVLSDFSPDVRDESVEACGGLHRDDGRVSAPGRMKIIVEFELFNRMAESLAKPGGVLNGRHDFGRVLVSAGVVRAKADPQISARPP